MTDPAGTLEKALERILFNVRHDRRWPLLELTLGEVLDDPSDSNKTRIPRRWKCSRRVCPMQLRGKASPTQEFGCAIIYVALYRKENHWPLVSLPAPGWHLKGARQSD